MKQNRLMKFCAVLALGLMSSATTFAQEVVFSVDKGRQFVAPGDTVTLSLNVKTTTKVVAFSGRVNLPEGLSFVSTKADAQKYVVEKTNLTNAADVSLVGKTNKSAAINVSRIAGFKATNAEVALVKFKVTADKSIPVLNTISYTDFKGAAVGASYQQDDFTSTVYNADYEATPTMKDFNIEKGKKATVAVALNFDKKVRNVQFDFVLPEGLTIDEDSYDVTERDPLHSVIPAGENGVAILAPAFPENLDDRFFIGTEGDILTFDVIASEDFKSSQLQIVNFAAYAPEVEYYGKEITVNVTEGLPTGINGIDAANSGEAADGIYQLNGVRTDKMQRGVNIVIKDGKAIKVVKK